MKAALVTVVSLLLGGCSALNSVGIGGEPILQCQYRDGAAYIDDRIVGPDAARLSVVRRFKDGDDACKNVMLLELMKLKKASGEGT